METHVPKGVTMGLFTNRRREIGDADIVKSSEAIDRLDPTWINQPPEPIDYWAETPDPYTDRGVEPSEVARDIADTIPEVAAPFDDDPQAPNAHEDEAERSLAEHGITLHDVEPAVPPAPRRTLTEQPLGTVQTAHVSNVEIDVHGLLDMLGVSPDASLVDISDARRRFLAQHDPAAEDDPDAARLKEQIRRRVNTAYASFRLTRVG